MTADLLRSQQLARVQGQQQQQLNQQQPFGGPSQPGQPFHDPSSNQSPQSQHPAFMNNPNGAGNGPSLPSRNPAIHQGFSNDINRQLLMLQQQNQQNNAGVPMNFALRQQQIQTMNQNQGSSPDTHNLFPSQGMDRRPSPAHSLPLPNSMPPGPSKSIGGQGQAPMPQPQGQGPQVRRPTMAEIGERMSSLRAAIMQHETMLQHMSNQHHQTAQNGGQPDQLLMNKIRQTMMSTKEKKDQLHKLMVMAQNAYVSFFFFQVFCGKLALLNPARFS